MKKLVILATIIITALLVRWIQVHVYLHWIIGIVR